MLQLILAVGWWWWLCWMLIMNDDMQLLGQIDISIRHCGSCHLQHCCLLHLEAPRCEGVLFHQLAHLDKAAILCQHAVEPHVHGGHECIDCGKHYSHDANNRANDCTAPTSGMHTVM